MTACRIRDRIEIDKYYTANYGAPGMKRAEKKNRTPEEMAKQNYWKRCRDLRRIIELNFGEGDLHVVLTCKKEERPDKEEAPKVIRKFRDRLAREYKKQVWELKYVITCEIGQRGAVHWHMIINNMTSERTSTTKLIQKYWIRGRPYFTALDGSGDYKKLAEYIVKETAEKIKKEETCEKLSYIASRNLKKPQVKRSNVKAKKWKKEPVVPKGWELVAESLINGINRYTGLPYQKYVIRRIPGKEKKKDAGGRYIHRHKHKGT